jgi:hypothetical protein
MTDPSFGFSPSKSCKDQVNCEKCGSNHQKYCVDPKRREEYFSKK